MRIYRPRSWAALRLEGWRRCEATIQSPTRMKGQEYPSMRAGVAVRGTQCARMVSPETIKTHGGLVVCKQHFRGHVARLNAKAQHIAERRRKLDPGCSVE